MMKILNSAAILSCLINTVCASSWTDQDPSRQSIPTRASRQVQDGYVEVRVNLPGMVAFQGSFTRTDNSIQLTTKEVIENAVGIGCYNFSTTVYLDEWVLDHHSMFGNFVAVFKVKNGANNFVPFKRLFSSDGQNVFYEKVH